MQNIQQAMKQAQMLQQKMAELHKKLENEEVTGVSGGGMVKITCTCKGIVRKLDIDQSLMDPNDKETLEDLIVAAFNNAKSNADATTEKQMSELTSSLGIPPHLLNGLMG